MNFNKITITFYLLLLSYASVSKEEDREKKYFSRKEYIKIISNTIGYKSKVEYKGEFNNDKEKIETITHTEFDEIYNVKPKFYDAKNKLKSLSPKKFAYTSVNSQGIFFSGVNAILLDYSDASGRFEYSYETTCTELMNLNHLVLNSQIKTDTFYYQIEVPNNYNILFNTTSLNNIKIDSTINPKYKLYKITSIPTTKIKAIKNKNLYEVFDMAQYYIRLLVFESKYEPWQYFNNWYKNVSSKQKVLSEDNFRKFDNEYISKLKNKDSIPIVIFNFIKHKISYIAIENGIEAYQPRDPNLILKHQKGDCKDVANLTMQLLNKYGYESYIALCASVDYIFSSDFPSAISYNHAICVVKLNNKWVYLDATEEECKFGNPSLAIQGQMALITTDSFPTLTKIEIIPSTENKNIFSIKSIIVDNKIESEFKHDIYGLNLIEMNTAYEMLNNLDFNMYLQKKTETIFRNNHVEKKIFFSKNENFSTIEGNFSNENFVIKNNSKYYLTINWLPFPHFYQTKPIESDKFLCLQTSQNNFNCEISIEKGRKIKKVDPFIYVDSDFSFSLSVSQTENVIHINYSFECNKIILEKNEISKFNELNKMILTVFNTPICYE